jgi:hypothetical protein
MMALHAGFLVAFTQLIPEHQVQLFGVIKVRVKVTNTAFVWFFNLQVKCEGLIQSNCVSL